MRCLKFMLVSEWYLSKNYVRINGKFTMSAWTNEWEKMNKKKLFKFNSMQMVIVAMDNDDYEFQITHELNFVSCA